jgi:hypothetical protein
MRVLLLRSSGARWERCEAINKSTIRADLPVSLARRIPGAPSNCQSQVPCI